jgi:hypothetical protein
MSWKRACYPEVAKSMAHFEGDLVEANFSSFSIPYISLLKFVIFLEPPIHSELGGMGIWEEEMNISVPRWSTECTGRRGNCTG